MSENTFCVVINFIIFELEMMNYFETARIIMSYHEIDFFPNTRDIVYTVGLRTQIVAVMSHVYVALHTECAFIYRGCDVISTVE